jgi:hypothetical protein
MDTKEILRMAGDISLNFANRSDESTLIEFAEAIAAAEREACAKVCENVREQDARGGNDSYLEGRQMGATVCMNSIRMRSNV